MKFFRPTLASILNNFEKTIEDLEDLAERNYARARARGAKAKALMDEADALDGAAARATTVASKLRVLIT